MGGSASAPAGPASATASVEKGRADCVDAGSRAAVDGGASASVDRAGERPGAISAVVGRLSERFVVAAGAPDGALGAAAGPAATAPRWTAGGASGDPIDDGGTFLTGRSRGGASVRGAGAAAGPARASGHDAGIGRNRASGESMRAATA
ncbi:MAG TPA: hypothetical protein VGM69_02040 [Chloroflexota bacterium]